MSESSAKRLKAEMEGHIEQSLKMQMQEEMIQKTGNKVVRMQPKVEKAEVGISGLVRLVGVDYLSAVVEPDIVEGHHALLSAGVVLLEGLDLLLPGEDLSGGVRGSPPGLWATLLCLPPPIVGADGTPVRAALAFPRPGAAAAPAAHQSF